MFSYNAFFPIFYDFKLFNAFLYSWESKGKDLNMNNTYDLMMIDKTKNEHVRGDLPRNINISTVLVNVFEKSKTVNKIPDLPYFKIKEKILENFIEIKI
jgi:hypothetical protein